MKLTLFENEMTVELSTHDKIRFDNTLQYLQDFYSTGIYEKHVETINGCYYAYIDFDDEHLYKSFILDFIEDKLI